MKLIYVPVLIACLLFAACGSKNGELTIENDTDQNTTITVNNEEFLLLPYEQKVFTWKLSNPLIGSEETKNVEAIIHKRILILNDITFNLTIKPGSSQVRKVSNYFNTSAMEIQNITGSFAVVQFYYTQNLNNWGDNVLTAPLRPGQRLQWNVNPGRWHVRWVDDWNDTYERRNQELVIGSIKTFIHSGE